MDPILELREREPAHAFVPPIRGGQYDDDHPCHGNDAQEHRHDPEQDPAEPPQRGIH